MAVTATSICNMALAHIQTNQINDISEEGVEAKQCRLFYDNIRGVMLQSFDWNFARISMNLPLHVESPPDTNWQYQYIYPSQALVIRKLTFKDDPSRQIDYKSGLVEDSNGAELKVLWCNFPDPLCVYTKNISSDALMTPMFVIALSYRLAIELAPALNLEGRVERVTRLFAGAEFQAQESDANEYRDMIGHVDLADTMNGRDDLAGYFGS